MNFNQQVGPEFAVTQYECRSSLWVVLSVCQCVSYDLYFLWRSHGRFLMTAIEGQRDLASHAHTHTVPWSNRQAVALSLRKSDTLSVGSSCPQSQSIGELFPSCWTYLDPLCPLRQAWHKGQCTGLIPRLSSYSNSNQISFNKIKNNKEHLVSWVIYKSNGDLQCRFSF